MKISVDALLFDLDGTLIDSKRDLAAAIHHLQEHYGVRRSSVKDVAGFVGDGVVKLVERALPELHGSRRDEAVAAFKQYYRDHCLEHTTLYPGVRKILTHFRHKKLAVVTNKPARISGYMLDALKLSSSFDVLIGGDSLPHKKPHPEPILSALKTMGLRNAQRAVVIGDSPNDVEAGRAAGAITCGIESNIGDPSKLRSSRPDFMLKNLAVLTHLFSQ